MKTRLATTLLLALSVASGTLLAQNSPTTAAPAPVAAVADDAMTSPAADEVLPLVQFEDAPLVDVIKALARQANLNLIFDPQVVAVGTDGASPYPPVTVRLENVTARNVLEAVLNNNNLRLESDPKTQIPRVAVKDPNAAEPLETKVYQLKYANPTNLVGILRPTFGSPRSQAIPDTRTSQLIVLATEKELLGVDTLIEKLDTATRQVLIEARIVETFRNPSTIKGIDWSGTFKEQTFTFGNGRGFGQETMDSSKVTLDDGTTRTTTRTSSESEQITGLAGTAGLAMNTAAGFFPATAFLNADGVSAVFSWFNEDNESEVIATPRTVTSDNNAARLEVTRAIPIFRVTTGGTQSGPTVDITYTNLGTILEVTPRISANDNIALKVVPEVSSVEGQDEQVLNGELQTANIFNIRRMTTQVLIPSGNTLVIGGLISDNTTKISSKVPVLGDIPGMKYIFGSRGKSRRKANLLIFVTPTLVQDQDFQPTESDFLKRKAPADRPDSDISPFDKPWDGVEPHDWSKPVY